MLEKSLATVENLSRKVGFNPWARTRTRCSLGPFPYVVVWVFSPLFLPLWSTGGGSQAREGHVGAVRSGVYFCALTPIGTSPTLHGT
jgi:hypothetical protein